MKHFAWISGALLVALMVLGGCNQPQTVSSAGASAATPSETAVTPTNTTPTRETPGEKTVAATETPTAPMAAAPDMGSKTMPAPPLPAKRDPRTEAKEGSATDAKGRNPDPAKATAVASEDGQVDAAADAPKQATTTKPATPANAKPTKPKFEGDSMATRDAFVGRWVFEFPRQAMANAKKMKQREESRTGKDWALPNFEIVFNSDGTFTMIQEAGPTKKTYVGTFAVASGVATCDVKTVNGKAPNDRQRTFRVVMEKGRRAIMRNDNERYVKSGA